MSLIAIILTHNEAANVVACIECLRWADAILVFDSFSTDDTIRLATEAGARVIQHPFADYTAQRNAALAAVTDDWVFFVDADERSSPEQAEEIRRVIADSAYAECDGFWVPRHNYIFGRLTRHAGWYPDYQMRLLRHSGAHYDTSRKVHELVILKGKAGYLHTPLTHYNYRDMRQFLEKQALYTDYAARDLFAQGIRARPQNFVLQPLRQFWWRFVTLEGYRDGLHGLRLSVLLAWYEFKKYVRLVQLARAGT